VNTAKSMGDLAQQMSDPSFRKQRRLGTHAKSASAMRLLDW
jgi:hypothetical protein